MRNTHDTAAMFNVHTDEQIEYVVIVDNMQSQTRKKRVRRFERAKDNKQCV